MTTTQPLEIEVKFHLNAVEPIHKAILEIGATPAPRLFETNLRYEDADSSFIRRNMLLRLRTDAQTTLTLKRPPPKSDPEFKVHRELEVQVSDFDTMDAILQGIGLHRAQCYEKWRQTLVLEDVVFCIDTLPFGQFLEIEGPKAAIIAMAGRLGLNWQRRIVCNYLEMFEVIKREHNLTFTDVTFANFANVSVDLAASHQQFEAGYIS